MSIARIASRYAKSLIELAQDQGRLERVVGDINLFNDAIQHRDLYLLIKSPIVKADKKLKIFHELFGERVDHLTLSFFDIIIRKGIETFLPDIARHFIKNYRELKNITLAQVTTATPLEEYQIEKIKSELKKIGVATGEVQLEEVVNPNIIGGFLLEVDDQLYDASVKTKLTNLKKEILDNSYIKSL